MLQHCTVQHCTTRALPRECCMAAVNPPLDTISLESVRSANRSRRLTGNVLTRVSALRCSGFIYVCLFVFVLSSFFSITQRHGTPPATTQPPFRAEYSARKSNLATGGRRKFKFRPRMGTSARSFFEENLERPARRFSHGGGGIFSGLVRDLYPLLVCFQDVTIECPRFFILL